MARSPLFTRSYDFLSWLVPMTLHFPRSQRFVVTKRLQDAALDFHERIIAANHAHGGPRIEKLIAADEALDRVRMYLRLCEQWKWVSTGQYRHAAAMLAEMGSPARRLAAGYEAVRSRGGYPAGLGRKGRVARGGSWNNNRINARCAYRNRNNPNNRNNNTGFRVVVSHDSRMPEMLFGLAAEQPRPQESQCDLHPGRAVARVNIEKACSPWRVIHLEQAIGRLSSHTPVVLRFHQAAII